MKIINNLIQFIFFIFLSIIIGCNHPQKFESHLQNQECEQALLEVPENQNLYKITQVSEQATGKLISYSFTGAAYTAQVLWDATVGITSAILLCAPWIATVALAKEQSVRPNSNLCFQADIRPLLAPQLGKNAYAKTENLRCPELTGLSSSIRKVAQCYSQRNNKVDLDKAIKILNSAQDSKQFYACLPNEESKLFIRDLEIYQNQFKMFP